MSKVALKNTYDRKFNAHAERRATRKIEWLTLVSPPTNETWEAADDAFEQIDVKFDRRCQKRWEHLRLVEALEGDLE